MMVNMGMYDNDDTGHAWLRTSRGAASIAQPASRFMRYFICMCTLYMLASVIATFLFQGGFKLSLGVVQSKKLSSCH